MFKGKVNGIDPELSQKTKFKNDILFRTNVMSIFKNFIRFNFE